MAITEERLAALESAYEAATPGPRKAVNLNDGDPVEYGPFWAVTNDVMDEESDWALEIRVGGKEDAEFDAQVYNAVPELIAEVRRLRHLETAIRDLRASQTRRVNPTWEIIDALLERGGGE